jgi:hypothetical protein
VAACCFFQQGPLYSHSQENPPAEPQKQSATTAKPESSTPKPNRVWTNENLSSFPSQVSAVGGQSSDAARASNSKSSFSNGATFLTPPDGQVVHPGEVVHFDLSIAPGRSTGPVSLASPLGISSELRESAPYSFTLEIPTSDSVVGGASLIGIHPVTAFGKIPGKEEYGLGAIEVDVEESDMPTKLEEFSNGSTNGASGFRFFDVGQEDWLAIYGTFPNGDNLDLNGSTHLKVVSENAKVATVSDGRVMAIGPGKTTLRATYSLGDESIQITVPVSVTVETTSLVLSPRSLDFGDLHVGTASSPQKVTLTNNSEDLITVYKFDVRAAVRETDDCTAVPLPPKGSCTISIIFTPFGSGPGQGVIYIPNSFSGMLPLPILGNGI